MVVPFVHCKLVAPLVVDGSPTIKSSCSVGVNGFTGSSFICICSEELVLVLCEARIGGPLWLAPVFGAGSSSMFHSTCWGLLL
jgi:hypothetical protein